MPLLLQPVINPEFDVNVMLLEKGKNPFPLSLSAILQKRMVSFAQSSKNATVLMPLLHSNVNALLVPVPPGLPSIIKWFVLVMLNTEVLAGDDKTREVTFDAGLIVKVLFIAVPIPVTFIGYVSFALL